MEGTETITFTIVPGSLYTGSGSATMNLFDDDTPQVTVSKIADAAENGGAGTFRISRSGPTTSSLGVTFTTGGTATSGTDYTSIGTSATITSGNSYVDVTVTALADNVVESGGETVTIAITDGGSSYTAKNATASLSVSDDPPIVSIAATGSAEGANGKFRISRTGGKIADALTVNYTVTGGTADSGDDFTALSGSVVIGATNTYADVTVAALADNLVEGDETLEVTISSGGTGYTIGTATDTLTITDDPPVISVSRLNDGTEGAGNGTFRVSRTGGDISDSIIVTYTVGGTAIYTSNTDYTALSGTVTIASSASYADITVTVTNDSSVESAETVILTLDTDDDWINGSASATLFIWDNDTAGFVWDGSDNTNWMDPDNWVGNTVPGSGDIAIFTGSTHTYNPVLSGPLSPVIVGGITVDATFVGTITIAFPIETGLLNVAAGTIDQPSSAYGSDITVTAAASWTGGVLNSTANAASVIFDGAAVAIDAAATALEAGSKFEFVSATATVAPSAVNTITFTNGQGLIAGASAYLALGVFGLPGGVIDGNIKVDGGIVTIMGGTSANSLEVLHGGEVSIAGGKVSFTGTVPGSSSTSVDVYGGILNIEGGSTLDGGTNDIHVSGWAGSPTYASELNTFAGASSTEAKIAANKLYVGFTAGDVTVTIGKSGAPPGNHIYGVLNVQCPVEWHRGVYKPTVHGTQQGTRDRWITSGVNNTFKIKGSATSVEPIAAPGVSVNNQYAVLQSDAMFAELPNNNGDKPGLPLVNAKSETMWEWNASKAFYGEATVWHAKSKAV